MEQAEEEKEKVREEEEREQAREEEEKERGLRKKVKRRVRELEVDAGFSCLPVGFQ